MSQNLNDNRRDEQANGNSEIFISRSEKRRAEAAEAEVKPKKKKSLLRAQKATICILLVFSIVLGISAAVVHKIVSRNKWVDEKGDGAKYYVVEREGEFIITDTDGYTLGKTEDNKYYVTQAGNIIDVDKKTGAVSYYAYVDIEGNEELSTNDRVLMFPYTPRENIQKIEVHNHKDDFIFEKIKYKEAGTEKEKFVIKGHEEIPFDAQAFALLVVTCGKTLSMMRFTEEDLEPYKDIETYGLVDEVRVDEEGNEYNYSPAWFKLTDTKGNVHKVIIGDPIPSFGGYYAKYSDRDTVYVLGLQTTSVESLTSYQSDVNPVLDTLESMCTPQIALTMQMNNYFEVSTFIIWNDQTDFDDPFKTKPLITFEYLDLSKRQNTEYQYTPYYSFKELVSKDEDGNETKIDVTPKVSNVDEYTIDDVLQSLYLLPSRTSGVKVVTIDITEDNLDEVLETYGLKNPAYRMFFLFQDTPHDIAFSEMTENGTYYVLSGLYDMIIEVDADYFRFFELHDSHWISDYFTPYNVAFLKRLAVTTKDFSYNFLCDNSKSDMSNGINHKNLQVTLEEGNKAIDASQLRKLFQVVLYTSYEGDADLTEEEAAALVANENNLMLTLRCVTAGRDLEYKFYKYSERRAYVTVNGIGGRYVLVSQVEKLAADAQRVITGETIDPESKY